MKTPFRILCVCMSNVCRSPTAEAVLRQLIERNCLGDRIEVSSAGTHGYRAGDACDTNSQRVASARGYDLSSIRARKVGWQDMEYFDLILAMDRTNLYNLRRMATEEQLMRIRLLMDYATRFSEDEVPDPYLTLGGRFELVLDLIEDAATGLLEEFKRQLEPATGKAADFSQRTMQR
ncbi:MAG: low molecular weight phosphotyrosine protein phosphatase [Dechloromonas sp.]|uniref:low molecular weight protein-tyrosine-phosphatase n=1 Tax=Ferribacterium limneticum TaxID=76259 RepID=UPI001CF921F6|nr:low molecular weight protein-tyrosine-phosphatase [Ferribacterium limneticum]MBT9520525.1 low molecular weight phosphotyrosine protein phosphatase [Dechloromonas sp.]UCV23223.1 low molecular weight phosphotyrosine protein phosphatase [Ferribacterium limneticum]